MELHTAFDLFKLGVFLKPGESVKIGIENASRSLYQGFAFLQPDLPQDSAKCIVRNRSLSYANQVLLYAKMDPTAIIIGAGPSGIALAHKLKHTLGYENFTIYEKLDGVGGTWRLNNYPGWSVRHALSNSYFYKSTDDI